MKPESLHALVIDHHLGELPPEAAELLEHHLSAHPAARAEADRLLATLELTRATVMKHPELARDSTPLPAPSSQRLWRTSRLLARVAAALALAGLAGFGGYFAGRSDSPTATTSAPRPGSPWARYRMALDPAGAGWQVVRVETTPHLR